MPSEPMKTYAHNPGQIAFSYSRLRRLFWAIRWKTILDVVEFNEDNSLLEDNHLFSRYIRVQNKFTLFQVTIELMNLFSTHFVKKKYFPGGSFSQSLKLDREFVLKSYVNNTWM